MPARKARCLARRTGHNAWPRSRTTQARPPTNKSGLVRDIRRGRSARVRARIGSDLRPYRGSESSSGRPCDPPSNTTLTGWAAANRGRARPLPVARRLRRSPALAPAATRRATQSSGNGTSGEGRSHPPASTASASYRTSEDPQAGENPPNLDDSLFSGSSAAAIAASGQFDRRQARLDRALEL